MDILVATNNQGKVKEFKELLNSSSFSFFSLKDIDLKIDVEEDGKTFEENALKKAKEISKFTNKITIADDSGLMVDAIDGRPGIYSARYAGENASDLDRNLKLLAELDYIKNIAERKAKFVCCIALVNPDDNIIKTFTGECHGYITFEMAGNNGFGYDPIFIPNGFSKTFGELDSQTKNNISHRAIAMKKLCEYLK